jgi:hypothetical protein
MSKMEEATGLLALALGTQGTPAERLKALEKANDLRKDLKVGWGKLGSPEGFNMADALGTLQDEAKAAVVADKPQDEPKVPAANADAPKKDRGGIGRLVNELLTETDDDYATIVAKVVEKFPEAKTTARSVASVAADLRRDGVDVKTRRKGKKTAAAA